MRKVFSAFGACLLLMCSCTGNQTPKPTAIADSIADTVDSVPSDTLEQLLIDTPMPKAADELFDDFVFNFAANKRLQKERVVFPLKVRKADGEEIISKEKWEMERFFMRQGYYTLMFNDERQMTLMKDTSLKAAVVQKIQLRKKVIKDYVFRRIRGAWMLLEIKESPIE